MTQTRGVTAVKEEGGAVPVLPTSRRRPLGVMKRILRSWQLYVLLLPAILYTAIFSYIPMYGIQIAFKRFSPRLGFWDSPWAGFVYFERFFNSYYFWRLLWNTERRLK